MVRWEGGWLGRGDMGMWVENLSHEQAKKGTQSVDGPCPLWFAALSHFINPKILTS